MSCYSVKAKFGASVTETAAAASRFINERNVLRCVLCVGGSEAPVLSLLLSKPIISYARGGGGAQMGFHRH